MRYYYHFWGGTGYCGHDFDDYMMFSYEPDTEELDGLADSMTLDNAESYEYSVFGWGYTIEQYMQDNDIRDREIAESEWNECIEEYYESRWVEYEEVSEEEYLENCR